jgi:hypothetical protein
MGYRPLNDDIWLKPIAYHCISYNLKTKEIRNIFKSGEIRDWKTRIYNEKDDFLMFLKDFEVFDYRSHPSNFEFLTLGEDIELEIL